jgi:hypothetical protein
MNLLLLLFFYMSAQEGGEGSIELQQDFKMLRNFSQLNKNINRNIPAVVD